MKVPTILLASTLAIVCAAQSNVTCVSGAYVVVARASEEAPGFGVLASVKDEILNQIPDSTAVAVAYPASISTPVGYFESEPDGVGNMTVLVEAYGDACPDRKIVLLGYSQGAQVVADVLVGNNNTAFVESPGLAQKYINQVAAAVMMGDPTKSIDGERAFLVGNSTHNGIFPRKNNDQWAARGLVNKSVSYCDANDTYCDGGPGEYGHLVHAGYVTRYGQAAATFVVEKFAYYNSTTVSSSNGTESTYPNNTATTTASGPSRTPSGPSSTTGAGNAATTTAPPSSAAAFGISSSCILMAALALAMVI